MDAQVGSHWQSKKEVEEAGLPDSVSTGYLLKKDEQQIILIGTSSNDECNAVTQIPAEWVKDILTIREAVNDE